MIHAYDKTYLGKARVSLGRLLDFAVYYLQVDLRTFWLMFLDTDICRRFEQGDPSVLAGMSGVEMAYAVVGDNGERLQPLPSVERSEEYWLGWAIGYYQWETGLPFKDLFDPDEIEQIKALYHPYHEMDIRHFCNVMNERYLSRHRLTNLKQIREKANMSQSQLARDSEVPVRTIQQYEQRQKNINSARAEYVIKLAKALCCKPEDLIERVLPAD